jgi:hypothetical protein
MKCDMCKQEKELVKESICMGQGFCEECYNKDFPEDYD